MNSVHGLYFAQYKEKHLTAFPSVFTGRNGSETGSSSSLPWDMVGSAAAVLLFGQENGTPEI